MKVLNILWMKPKYKLFKRKMGCSSKRRNLQTPKVVLYRTHSVGRAPSCCILLKLSEVVYMANTRYIFMQNTMSWRRLQEQALQYPKARQLTQGA